MPQKNELPHTRASDFPLWYQDVVGAADLAENSLVRGCMVIKPWGYALWERIQSGLDRRFRETGHENAYFPLFIPQSLIEKEAEHVKGFAKEMAVVTHHRLAEGEEGGLVPDGELAEPLVVRPTSETIIGESFSKWVNSYRDLPLLINQWANVVRWEMRPRLFLRTAEFLWQEGHTVHATAEDAMEETMRMLEVYREFAEDVMAMPVIVGEKPEHERFPGAERTFTIEAMMQDGKALQAGTSHYLGENFARSSKIEFTDSDGKVKLAHTTSWGVSTRLIGGIVMTHGDDIGLRLPPAISPQQVIVMPSQVDDPAVREACQALARRLGEQAWRDEPVRAQVDLRDSKPGAKRWTWIRRGAPLVVEVGARELESRGAVVAKRWSEAPNRGEAISQDELCGNLGALLDEGQRALWEEATEFRRRRLTDEPDSLESVKARFGGEEDGFVQIPWSGDLAALAELDELAVGVRCIPLGAEVDGRPCALTGEAARYQAVLARSY